MLAADLGLSIRHQLKIASSWERENGVAAADLHPGAPHHLPGFIAAPGETDVLMIAMGILLILAVLAVGNIFLRLHTLPERMAHKSQKLQFEIVAVLGLLALFTHIHLFWVIGLLLAMIDLPDFSTPLKQIAGSVGKIANNPPDQDPAYASLDEASVNVQEPTEVRPDAGHKEKVHA
jgi:hypothetical protein